jgi:GNAT superfamily N-acetyltransferase
VLHVRPAEAVDLEPLAALWEQGWHDGHDGHVPEAFQQARTSASFRERMAERIGATTVVERDGDLAGFVTVVGDELEQVFVAPAHRGGDVAPRLLVEGLRAVAAAGHRLAWLSVVVGNARARRFYEREGWVDAGPLDYLAQGPDGPIVSPCRRYEHPARPHL